MRTRILAPWQPIAFTAGSWFSCLNWINSHNTLPFTFSIHSGQDEESLTLFSQDLAHGE
jgi:hypothetical protein